MLKLKKIIKIGFRIFAITFIVIVLWSIFVEPNMLITRNETLFIPHWNKKLNGMKVALVADPHVGTINSKLDKLKKVVDLVNKQKPDIIFLLGDFDTYSISSSGINKNKISGLLSQFSAPLGVIAILGNHDCWRDTIILNILKKAKIPLLQDSNIALKYKDTTFYVAGLQDYWHYPLNIEKAIQSIPENSSIILLSHNPDVFPKVPARISLTLSGHTHGGVIILPYFGSLFSPSNYYQRYVKGYIVENNKHLYVSSGYAGAPPIRFNNPPEIVILTLRSQEYTDKPIMNTPVRQGIKGSMIPFYFKLRGYVVTAISKIFNKNIDW